MSEVEAIVTRARSLGLTLCVEGERIAIAPARLCTPGLLSALREHKPAVLSLLRGQCAGLRPDEIPWLHVAQQVIWGEFADCDGSTCDSLRIGLRSIRHPLCRRALERLEAQIENRKAKGQR